MSAPSSQSMTRETASSAPCMRASAACCDCVGVCVALPCLACGPCAQCASGPYGDLAYPPPAQRTRGHRLDRWYRSSIHTLHGGSLNQLIATQALYWRFPLEGRANDVALHRVAVAPRNPCGACCFAPLVRASAPQFRIRALPGGALSVRLNAAPCGCGAPRACTGCELNDVWRASDDGRIVNSMKTRGHAACACDDYCVLNFATGPATFVAAEGVIEVEDVLAALASGH